MSLLYAITVENADTGDREAHLWNVTADSHDEALRQSDASLRALGWPAGWKSTAARIIGPGIVVNTGQTAIVEDILPGTPEWEVSEQQLEQQRRHGG
jgi:hypothetical protein